MLQRKLQYFPLPVKGLIVGKISNCVEVSKEAEERGFGKKVGTTQSIMDWGGCVIW